MIILGIESSCDETSVSIVKEDMGEGHILCEKVLSQVTKHRKFGGVVPELASREHSDSISKLTKDVLKKSNLEIDSIDAFAATTGPGLLGGLLVGCNYAKEPGNNNWKTFFINQSLTSSRPSCKNER